MQFDLRKFIATGTKPYHAEFPCDLSARDFAGARIEQPVTACFDAETDGDEVRMTLRAKALVHGECARCLDPVEREESLSMTQVLRVQTVSTLQPSAPIHRVRFRRVHLYLISRHSTDKTLTLLQAITAVQ